MLSFMEHRPTRICVEAERGLLAGSTAAVRFPSPDMRKCLTTAPSNWKALVGEVDGSVIIRRKVTAAPMKPAPWASLWPVPRRGRAGPRSSPGCTRGKFSVAGLFRLPLSRFDFPACAARKADTF